MKQSGGKLHPSPNIYGFLEKDTQFLREVKSLSVRKVEKLLEETKN